MPSRHVKAPNKSKPHQALNYCLRKRICLIRIYHQIFKQLYNFLNLFLLNLWYSSFGSKHLALIKFMLCLKYLPQFHFLMLDMVPFPNSKQNLCSSDRWLENSSEKGSDSNLGLLGKKHQCYLCAMQPPPFLS